MVRHCFKTVLAVGAPDSNWCMLTEAVEVSLAQAPAWTSTASFAIAHFATMKRAILRGRELTVVLVAAFLACRFGILLPHFNIISIDFNLKVDRSLF